MGGQVTPATMEEYLRLLQKRVRNLELRLDGRRSAPRVDPDVIVPPGLIFIWPGLLAPEGPWALVAGQAISRAENPKVFAMMGNAYGAGNGTTTFNLPDIRGRVPVGRNSLNALFRSLGNTGGEIEHQLTLAELAIHTHIQNPHTHVVSTGRSPAYFTPAGSTYGVQHSNENSGSTRATNQNAGGDQPHNNMPPYLIVNYLIKLG